MAAGKTVDGYIEGLRGEREAVARALHELVTAAAPRSTHSIKWSQPVYESGGPLIWMKASSKHVSLGFWTAPDPLTGTGEGITTIT